jgi:hypothetical protein
MVCPHPIKRSNDDTSSLKHTGHGSRSTLVWAFMVLSDYWCFWCYWQYIAKKFFNFIQGTYGSLGRSLPFILEKQYEWFVN